MRQNILPVVAITGHVLMPYLYVKPLCLIWSGDTRLFYIRLSNLQMSCMGLILQHGTKVIAPTMTAERHAPFNTLRPRHNGRHFPDDILKCIFRTEDVWIPITISLKFVPKGPINNIPALVQIMAWRRPGGKPLSEPVMVRFPTHICVTQPQWVKTCVDWCRLLYQNGIIKSLSQWPSYNIWLRRSVFTVQNSVMLYLCWPKSY